jgi:hypothetical protein
LVSGVVVRDLEVGVECGCGWLCEGDVIVILQRE